MKKVLFALVIMALLIGALAACGREATTVETQGPDEAVAEATDEWQTVTSYEQDFSVSIPATWLSDSLFTGPGRPRTMWVYGFGADGGVIGLTMLLLEPCSEACYDIEQPPDIDYVTFLFDNGTVGYMREDSCECCIFWYYIEEGVGILIRFWHNEDRSLFTDNEDVIWRIVRSVQPLQNND